MTPLNLVGAPPFGRLLVTAKRYERDSDGRVVWECSCACGGKKSATTFDLRSGRTQSCGCLRIMTNNLRRGGKREAARRRRAAKAAIREAKIRGLSYGSVHRDSVG